MSWETLLKKHARNEDLHILRFFSSFIAVSQGKVIDITEPVMEYCPLVSLFYKEMRAGHERGDFKNRIKEIVEEKIERFGFFTDKRSLIQKDVAVRYGASEMLMYALQKRNIDAAVVVCDGAGSVIVTIPELVQGIGARMNGLFFTSAIPEIVKKLQQSGSLVVFPDVIIDQVKAVQAACEKGYSKIAVTVNASMKEENFAAIRDLESKYGVDLTIMAICTTGISIERAEEIKTNADLVWSCSSNEVREIVGKGAILQVSEKIPVFVLTKKGLNFLAAYSDQEKAIKDLDVTKQYLISDKSEGTRLKMGENFTCLAERTLPVRSCKEPSMSLS